MRHLGGETPPFPPVLARVFADGTGEVTIGNTRHRINAGNVNGARAEAAALITQKAAQAVGGPVRVEATDPSGSSIVLVHPDGTVTAAPDPENPEISEPAPDPRSSGEDPESALAPAHAAPTPAAPSGPKHSRKSFIAAAPAISPAQVGVRGLLTRMGIRAMPSPAEQALRSDIRMVSQHWPGPRTIAIANGKGSANKTPTMVCLAAVFGRYGGTGVLGWDNNETRGTASWRTRQGPHTSTALDLLPHCDELLGTAAQAAQLAAYVHHQVEDKFDVLWSDQSIEGEHEISGEEVDAVHQVASKYYRLILMDSGNNERASNWRAMIGHSDQLVVPCTNVEDTAEAGARMLEALTQRDEHSAHLASSAVAIVSQRTPGRDPDMARIAAGFEPLVRRVVTVPHDPALYSGVIRFDSLRPATQRAWLAAGAAVAEDL